MTLLRKTDKHGYHKRLYLNFNDDYIQYKIYTYLITADHWFTVKAITFYGRTNKTVQWFGKEAINKLAEFAI